MQLKLIIVRKMLHNVFYTAPEDVAKFIDGVDLDILVMTQAVELRAIHVVMGVKVILGYTTQLHGLP